MGSATKQAVNRAFTPLSIVGTTASPTADFATAGDVSVAEEEATGAPKDREGVGADMVDSGAKGHPVWEGSPELQADGQIGQLLSVPGIGWEAGCVYNLCLVCVQESQVV